MLAHKKTTKSVNDYINQFPKNTQKILQKIRQIIQQIAPEAIEYISYGMPGYKLNGKALVYFAAYEKHIGFYPIPSGITAFKKELAPYKQGKGSVQFPLDEEIPYELIEKIVQFRVKQSYEN